MDVFEAVNKRRSTRAFKPDPVPEKIIKEIMALAQRAPSWTNTQPWEFAVVTGDKLKELRKALVARIGDPHTADFVRPQEYPEPLESRRMASMDITWGIKGIKRDDKEKRKWWDIQQFNNFGAPCEVFILTERSFFSQSKGQNVYSVFDCGMVAQTMMLAATGYGLGTIVQAMAVSYPDTIRKVLGIPDSKMVLIGVAIGYPDMDDKINQFRSDREPPDKVTRWYA